MITCVYVIGHSESGGSWIASGECYTDYELAKKILQKDRDVGITYTKIFTLYIKSE